MALPKYMRLKGHRPFDYIHKNSRRYYGKYMVVKVAKPNPGILISHGQIKNLSAFKIAVTVSKKVSKKAVIRNKIKRKLHINFLENFSKGNNQIPYWVLVNLNGSDFSNDESKLLKEFQILIKKLVF